MAAQFDYKAQWLTWVPFDHYWDGGKVCGFGPGDEAATQLMALVGGVVEMRTIMRRLLCRSYLLRGLALA